MTGHLPRAAAREDFCGFSCRESFILNGQGLTFDTGALLSLVGFLVSNDIPLQWPPPLFGRVGIQVEVKTNMAED